MGRIIEFIFAVIALRGAVVTGSGAGQNDAECWTDGANDETIIFDAFVVAVSPAAGLRFSVVPSRTWLSQTD